ncbi:DUF995 domain-containing protein [Brucella tritici]|uniref:DUF995 domain-containing protein n=1 Tax=Brucella tritici TaxID=94626 RepID=A0A833CNI7_9HYPH|nr:DUF995 domain-containing protein [Brucella tritici]KAB2665504.1 DUF995 domain-containing protein [Brucella tritici]KAB2673938.1 DUF995 domain-containing protein [Brucella tritici]
MFSIRLRTVSAALSVLLLAGAADAAPKPKTEDPVAIKAASASPLSAQALEALYSGRTWKWKDGGGYFSADRHRFIAWSQKGRVWSYAQGRWYATDSGKLCLQAYWVSKTGSSSDTTCFLHREQDGVIYQKRSLGGSWYVFRNNPPRSTDEAAKLLRGDRISKGLAIMKAKAR